MFIWFCDVKGISHRRRRRDTKTATSSSGSEMVSQIHSTTFSDLVTVIDISRRGESTKGHATTPNDIFRKLQPTHAGLAPHHAPTIWGRPQRVGVNPPQYIGVPTPTTPTRWGPLGSCDPNALGQIPQCPNTLGSIGVADPNALGSLDGICSQRSCQG